MGPRILISGASGLVGTALCTALREEGYHVIPLVRTLTLRKRSDLSFQNRPSPDQSTLSPAIAPHDENIVSAQNEPTPICVWNPTSAEIPEETIAAFDHAAAVIHLSGEPLVGNYPWTLRWTTRKKAKIRQSRIQSTELLAKTFIQMRREGRTPPRQFFVASGVGYYGYDVQAHLADRPESSNGDSRRAFSPNHFGMSTEASACGTGFLAELARDWEAAARTASEAGCRVVSTRLGVVLDPAGGMLGRMLPVFRTGVAVRWDDGKIPLSWIGLSDVASAFVWLLRNRKIEGAVNLCAPVPTTFGEFCQLLGTLTETRWSVTVPTWCVRLLGGEMANEMFLHGQRAYPKRLLCEGFGFRYPDIASLLIDFLGPPTLPLTVSEPPTTTE